MWKQLFKTLVLNEGFDLVRPSPEKIDAALNQVERELSFRLPQSYRAFIHQFGPGEIGGYFRIYGPHIRKFEDYGSHLLEERAMWLDPEGVFAMVGEPALVARLIPFSSTIGGDGIFWDPEDLRNAKQHEYGVYVLSRSHQNGEVQLVAESFKQFIEDVCLGHGFDQIGGGWNGELPPQEFGSAWKAVPIA